MPTWKGLSSPARVHMGRWGGGTGDTMEFEPGTPPLVQGSLYKKKVVQDLGLNQHTAATIRKEFLTPPLPKMGYPARGTRGTLLARHKERGFSFSVHCPRNIHRNKKNPGTLICWHHRSLQSERLRPWLNVQSMVGNPTLLLWLRRRGVTPSVKSSRAPMLLLTPYP